MQCTDCHTTNDNDAAFCSSCGKRLGEENTGKPGKQRRSYLFALLLVPVLLIAAGIGYYKYFLPDGIAAVVNGEEIKLSELDDVVRVQGEKGAVSGGARYQLLNQIITERIVLQELRLAGTTVSNGELETAKSDARASSGLDEPSFRKEVLERYGSMSVFEATLKRRVLMNKYLVEKVIPPGADPQIARAAVNRWFEAMSSKAVVRIALAEQGAGPGCSGCSKSDQGRSGCGQGGCGQGKQRQGCSAAPPSPVSNEKLKIAGDAGLQYWQSKHGTEVVTIRPQDFGCHIQLDVIKNDKIIGSLRYQDGNITEL